MGQIVGLKAKPKRCNLNKLSQLGTPAAGEYILVSYDNSMTANGQGNFDRYIMGDGRTAATALELKYLDDSTRPYIVEEVNKAVADIQPIEITGDVTNAPDEEDLTSENQGGTDVLKFKDKAYNSALYSGLGRVYLRKNIVTLEGTGKNVLTQAMVNTANTIYHIQYDYDLNGQTITLPAGCVLEFDGGSLANGTLKGNNTIINSVNVAFKRDLTIQGIWKNEVVYSRWFDFISSEDGVTDNSLQFKQLQAVINGTHGCRVEFTKGYYQTQIIGNEPDAYVEVGEVTYPKWLTNIYQKDARVVLRVSEVPYVNINLNGSTIRAINVECPCWEMIRLDGVTNGYVHDGTLIGMAINNFAYTEYANYNNVLTDNYELCTLLYQDGGFAKFFNLDIQYSTGDAIAAGSASWYFGVGDIRPSGVVESDTLVTFPADGYQITDSEISYCGRNGITCHSSLAGNIESCHIHHIGSDAGDSEIGTDGIMGKRPRAGIDVEFEDGQGLKPVMQWDNLNIHNCGRKVFGFATGAQSTMKQFTATNLHCIGFPLNNALNTDGGAEFNNCYFEQTEDYNEGGIIGSNIKYVDCKWTIKKDSITLGGASKTSFFYNCIFDASSVNTTTYTNGIFGLNDYTSEFYNCKFKLPSNKIGYLAYKKFYNCTLTTTAVGYAGFFCANSEFYDCVFDFKEVDNRNVALKRGNYSGGVLFERCTFNSIRGVGTSVGDYGIGYNSFSSAVKFKDCACIGLISICHKDMQIGFDGCNINTLFIRGYQQSSGSNPITINNCNISALYQQVNAHNISVYGSIITFTDTLADGIKYFAFENCIVNNTTAIAGSNVIVKGGSMNFTNNAATTGVTATGAIITGSTTELTFNGTHNGCVWETPIPTSGTTAQRPSASVAGVGFKYFDTDLNSPVYSDGTNWVLSANGGEDEVDHGTSDTTFTLTPNVLHKWGEVAALTLTLAAGTSGKINEYMFQFTSGSTPTVLTVPNTVNWVSAPNIEASTTYQASIVNNIGVIVGV